jgi:hypothetical protein
MENIFTEIYEKSIWGNNKNLEYSGSSGSGSDIDYNENKYVPFLKKFITENCIRSVVDLGCGDFRCGSLIYDDLEVSYNGYDAYKKVIDYNSSIYDFNKYTFHHLDFYNNKEQILGGDLCILKDVIQHWQINDIYHFLDYLVNQKKFKFILICNCSNQVKHNTNIKTGDFRPLNSKFLPLKKYNPKKLLNYNTKEVCVIRIQPE